MIGRLHAAVPGIGFDRIYLGQQIPAHLQALRVHGGYAQRGDNSALRENAQSAVPIVQSHLREAQLLVRSVR